MTNFEKLLQDIALDIKENGWSESSAPQPLKLWLAADVFSSLPKDLSQKILEMYIENKTSMNSIMDVFSNKPKNEEAQQVPPLTISKLALPNAPKPQNQIAQPDPTFLIAQLFNSNSTLPKLEDQAPSTPAKTQDQPFDTNISNLFQLLQKSNPVTPTHSSSTATTNSFSPRTPIISPIIDDGVDYPQENLLERHPDYVLFYETRTLADNTLTRDFVIKCLRCKKYNTRQSEKTKAMKNFRNHLQRSCIRDMVCPVCQQRVTKQKFEKHLFHKHNIRMKEEMYECDICHRDFLSQRSLRLHQLQTHAPLRGAESLTICQESESCQKDQFSKEKELLSGDDKNGGLSLSLKRSAEDEVMDSSTLESLQAILNIPQEKLIKIEKN